MARRRRYTAEQIITKLREAEIYLGQGKTVKVASTLVVINAKIKTRMGASWGFFVRINFIVRSPSKKLPVYFTQVS